MSHKIPEDEKIKLTDLTEIAVYNIISYYGTNVYGNEHRKKQQAKAICQLFYELDEVAGYIQSKKFRSVRVVATLSGLLQRRKR